MRNKAFILSLFVVTVMLTVAVTVKAQEEPYKPDWESLKKQKDPEWFRDAKFGIYTHWGVYSVPAFGNEWYPRWMYVDQTQRQRGNYYQYHKKNFGDPKEFGYKDFIPMFKAEKFNADKWAKLFQKAGAKFAGPVAEHHDGFSMWDSAVTKWDAKDMGPKRDIVGELEEAIRKRGMKFITSFHHARKWWYYENSYTPDKRYDTQDPKYAGLYPEPHEPGAPPTKAYMEEWKAKVIEVIDKYQPDLLWFDGGLANEKFWRSAAKNFERYKKEFLAYYYNKAEQWGREVSVTYKHQDFPEGTAILDIERGRQANLTDYIWLTDTAVDMKSWSYVNNPEYKPVNTLVDVLVDIVSKNGCLLLNVGPRADGVIPKEARDLLLGIGEWLKVNGEAIYGTRPWIMYGEGQAKVQSGAFKEQRESIYGAEDIRFTTKGKVLYAIALGWPGKQLMIKSLSTKQDPRLRGDKLAPAEGPRLAGTQAGVGNIESITLLGHYGGLKWSRDEKGLFIQLPDKKPCEHAFAFKIVFNQ